jgi:hypothetical protein
MRNKIALNWDYKERPDWLQAELPDLEIELPDLEIEPAVPGAGLLPGVVEFRDLLELRDRPVDGDVVLLEPAEHLLGEVR